MPDRKYAAVWPLFENSLAFYETHRGQVREQAGTYLLESERPEFSYAVLGPDHGSLPDDVKLVHVAPWSGNWERELRTRGFAPQGSLIWMSLEHLRHVPDGGIPIRRVETEADWEAFSQVQTRSYFESEPDYQSWLPWLRAANLRNRGAHDQVFYLASVGDQPAGTTLLLRRGEITGIYAVATAPAFRRRGISTALLTRAVSDARAAGAHTVTLQVNGGTPAEDFYRQTGFTEAFATQIWSR